MKRLSNKTALITGGSSGIGLATARAFLAEGARVAITGQSAEGLARAAAELGPDVLTIRANQASMADLDHVADVIRREFRDGLDVLFINAGVAKPAVLLDITPEHIKEHFDVNFNGVLFTIQKLASLLNKPSSVILTSTAGTEQGIAGLGVYSASKAAARLLVRTFSAELLSRGVRINAVSPGPIETPIFGKMGIPAEVLQQMAGELIGKVPMGRLGQADEVARAVTFLASDDSSYMTGQNLFVDGGMTAL